MRKQLSVIIVGLSLAAAAPLSAQEPKLRATLKGHTDEVRSVAFSPDGATLVAGARGEIKLWDVKTGQERGTLKGHKNAYVAFVLYSPDGTTLASACQGGTIKLWDVKTNQERHSLNNDFWVTALTFSPDGATLASACRGEIKLWDVATGKLRATLKGHTSIVYALAFSPDGATLASGGDPSAIKFWDVAQNQERRTLQGRDSHLRSLKFSPDGALLAAGLWPIKLYNVKTGDVTATLQGHKNGVLSVAFSPNGKLLASGSLDAGRDPPRFTSELWDRGLTLIVWDVQSGKEWVTLKGHTSVHAVAFSPDGTILASASEDRTIKLWDMPAAKKTDK